MNTMMFGRAPHSLFGVYHPPRTAKARRAGVVLCYPFGQEYMRAHRAFRQLALLLSAAGFHVMRFDYSSTGDSSGEGSDASLAQWTSDAAVAADELKDTADISRVSFVGLRLGAAVAVLAASSRKDVDEVVLWDPIVDGASHIGELLAPGTQALRHTASRDVVSIFGFPLTLQMRAEIAATDLRRVEAPHKSGRFLVASEERSDYDELRAPTSRCAYSLVPSAGDWNGVDDYGGALIPVAQIRSIVAHLSREVP